MRGVTALAGIQRDFFGALFDEQSASGRFEAYRRNALANLHGALAAAYPVVLRLVGDAFFREAAERFARTRGSTSGDLNEYGSPFPEFLATYPHASSLEYLADIARLEWAVHESRRAADLPLLDLGALARVAPELQGAIRFALHPAVRLIASPHPILALWEANQPQRDGTPAGDGGAARILVRRIDGVASPCAIGGHDWTFLAALERGATLDEACAALGDAAADFLAPALQCYARERVLGEFEAPSSA